MIDHELYGEEVISIFMYSFDILSRGCSALNIEEEDVTEPLHIKFCTMHIILFEEFREKTSQVCTEFLSVRFIKNS